MFAAGKTDGAVSAVVNYIEDVFSTYLYTGDGTTSRTITNGIDLSTKGGLVFIKTRNSGTDSWGWFDTARGAINGLSSNSTAAQLTYTGLSSVSTTGFVTSSGSADYYGQNTTGATVASWTFRKQPKFFDVVTWTGNGANYRAISHSLGSTPGCVIVKSTSASGAWAVWHQSVDPKNLILNSTSDAITGQFSIQDVGATTFAVANSSFYGFPQSIPVNDNGATYVAYVFANNAGGFGLTGTDNVISCGSYTGTGAAGNTITLGYEPQWVMIKRASGGTADWRIYDVMRNVGQLEPNTSDAEAGDPLQNALAIQATGFGIVDYTSGSLNANGSTYIYIAIRRGPMKVPTSGTSVFDPEIWSGNTTVDTATRSIPGIGSPTDLFIGSERDPGYNQNYFYDRLRGTDSVGGLLLVSSLTTSEATNSPGYGQYSFAQQDGITLGNYTLNYTGRTYVGWQFRRAPSFFDVVCYTGTGSTTTITHNLGVTPELVITKSRSQALGWVVWTTSLTSTDYWIRLDDTMAQANSPVGYGGTFSASNYTIANTGPYNALNNSGSTYVAYLFATCAGVSKVGSYTGTATTKQIDCGFTGGARFVLIKRTDATGAWYVWDSARGIVAGNDPYLLLNTTAAEVTSTDYVDTYSAGFEISSTAPAAINASGGTYIFLAIA